VARGGGRRARVLARRAGLQGAALISTRFPFAHSSGYSTCPFGFGRRKLMELTKTKNANVWLVLIYSSRHR
jgi:hypothetical protein